MDYDWLLFTDNREKYDYPLNVKVYHMEFQDFKKIIELKLGKEFNLETPYKFILPVTSIAHRWFGFSLINTPRDVLPFFFYKPLEHSFFQAPQRTVKF